METAVLRLFGDRRISSAEAARDLGLTRIAFMELTRQRNVPHYDYTAEDLAEDLADMDATMPRPIPPGAWVVVTNSSPLIYLAALSDFELIPRMFGDVSMPPPVWREVVEQGSAFPVHDAVRAATDKWLRVVPLEVPVQPLYIREHLLHLGETEVIRLAQQSRASMILMDDRLAVMHARALGFRVSPTVAIYIRAKRLGLIKSVKDKVDQLRSVGFHLSERDHRAVLTAAGEATS
jgi:uncharacterized protein